MEVFFFFGIVSCLLLSTVSRKDPRPGYSKVFGIWNLFVATHLALLYARFAGFYDQYPHLIGLDTPLVVLHLPFLYFYVCAILEKKIPAREVIIHVFPFAFLFLALLFTFYFKPASEKLAIFTELSTTGTPISIGDLILVVQTVFYSISFLIILKRQRHQSGYKLARFVVLFTLIVFGINTLLYTVTLNVSQIDIQQVASLSIINVCILYFLITYRTLKLDSRIQHGSSMKNGMDALKMQDYHSRLTTYLNVNKSYTNPDLSLIELAKQVDIPKHHLSHTINQCTGKSFYGLINEYRIREAETLLRKEQFAHYSILGIAMQAGFKSKSVFNQLFKKTYGQTPSAYRAKK